MKYIHYLTLFIIAVLIGYCSPYLLESDLSIHAKEGSEGHDYELPEFSYLIEDDFWLYRLLVQIQKSNRQVAEEPLNTEMYKCKEFVSALFALIEYHKKYPKLIEQLFGSQGNQPLTIRGDSFYVILPYSKKYQKELSDKLNKNFRLNPHHQRVVVDFLMCKDDIKNDPASFDILNKNGSSLYMMIAYRYFQKIMNLELSSPYHYYQKKISDADMRVINENKKEYYLKTNMNESDMKTLRNAFNRSFIWYDKQQRSRPVNMNGIIIPKEALDIDPIFFEYFKRIYRAQYLFYSNHRSMYVCFAPSRKFANEKERIQRSVFYEADSLARKNANMDFDEYMKGVKEEMLSKGESAFKFLSYLLKVEGLEFPDYLVLYCVEYD